MLAWSDGSRLGMLMVLPPLSASRRTASAIVAPLGGAASGTEPTSVGERLRIAVYAPPTYVPPGDVTLAQVIVVHRHGDRAPISRSAGSKLQCDASAWAARLLEPTEPQPPAPDGVGVVAAALAARRSAELAALNASFPVQGSLGGVGGANDPPFGQLTTKVRQPEP